MAQYHPEAIAPHELPRAVHKDWPEGWGGWPYYRVTADRWRNAREAGAWLAGLVTAIPEKCASVELDVSMIPGALVAMLEGGLVLEHHAGELAIDAAGATVTFRVWSAFEAWAAEPLG